jgi:hypothetical protein
MREMDVSVGARPRGMSRFDSSFQDFLYDNGLHYYTTQFYQELNVRSVQDLALISDDELRQVLPPTEMATFREALRKGGVKRIPPEQLVGRWIDVEGFGPGKVIHYHKVSNRFMFDSKHSIDFKGPEFKVLLRRRKFMRWNGGARYIVLEAEPSAMDAVEAVQNEHEVMETYQAENIETNYDDNNDDGDGVLSSNNVDDSWEACIDPNTGDTYYYNLITLETSWTLPEKKTPSFAPPPSAPAAPPPPPSSLLPPAEPAPEVQPRRARPESVKLLARPPSLRAMPKLPTAPKPQTSSSTTSPVPETTTITTIGDGKKNGKDAEASESPATEQHQEAKSKHLDKTLRSYKAINPKNLGKSPRGRSNSPVRRPSSRSVGGIPGSDLPLTSSSLPTPPNGGVIQGKTRIALISDLDGTMLPGPTKIDGKVVHPPITDGATYAPLVQFLEDGGSVFGVTGGALGLQKSRFWDCLPLQARREGRVMLFCETGMVLYRSKHQMDLLHPGWNTQPAPSKPTPSPVQPPPPAAADGECTQYQIDMTASAFGQCKCGKPKSEHSDAALKGGNRTSTMGRPTTPPPAATATPASNGECEQYQIDMSASAFGQCKCGKPKGEHSDAALKGGKRTPRPVSPPAPATTAAPASAAEYTGDGGEPVEDTFYGPFEGNTQRYLSEAVIDQVIAAMRKGLREFFTDLKADRSLLEEGHWIHGLADRWADEDAPVTEDRTLTPRIEMRKNSRGKTFGMIIAGCPVQYGSKYLSPKIVPFEKDVKGLPTGRLCFDVTVPGLGKHLMLDYLLRTKVITPGAAVAMADSPSGNDQGLTQRHKDGIPFISVYGGSHQSIRRVSTLSTSIITDPNNAKDNLDDSDTSPAFHILNEELTQILKDKVDPSLISCHVGGNEQGSAAVISRLIPLNRLGLPTPADTSSNDGKEKWLDIDRVESQVVQYAREDLIDL